MSSMLKAGASVRAALSGQPCEVGPLLGTGGQGEVYRATLSGQPLALKWYHPEWAKPAQRAALDVLVRKSAPHPMFLWPVDIVLAPSGPAFGYLMPLRDSRFKSGVDLARRRIEPTFRTLATAGYHLAHGFLLLHAQGLAYRDISFGNMFLDPRTGEVLICDLDNVGVNGQPHNQVGGTMQFMAPEIVIGKANPDALTDQHSLAVLLFYMFFMGHPLEGAREAAHACLNEAAFRDLYGANPVYLAHPTDQSNRPVPGRHDNVMAFWKVYPGFLKDLFAQSFVEGLHDPAARVKESQWRSALLQLRDSIVYCPACKAENFLPLKANGELSDTHPPCWACQKPLVLPPRLKLGNHIVALNHDTKLWAHHLDRQAPLNSGTPVAELAAHPKDPSIWGLRNLTNNTWKGTDASGTTLEVPPGRSVMLRAGTVLNFGLIEGTILGE